MEKINFLQQLQEGKTTIEDLMPVTVDFWMHYLDEPDIYINKKTGEKITAAEMKSKEQFRGNKILFLIVVFPPKN